MASLYETTNGGKSIQFAMAGKRITVRLGKIPRKAAETCRLHIEHLLNAQLMQTAPPAETAAWVGKLPDGSYAKLVKAGLLVARKATAVHTLGDLLNKFQGMLHGKPSTEVAYGNVIRNLRAFFGDSKPLGEISPADADSVRPWLLTHESLSPATANRRITAIKTIFRKGVRWQLLASNPFDGVIGGGQTNESRKHFVSPADAAALLEACPNHDWRCLVALSRYGGLRVPSEAMLLTWADVNWEKRTLHVKSPKTEHHAGQASRVVPLFPELHKVLLDAFEAATPGGEPWIITGYRDRGQNLRTQLERIIRRAGLTPWPKPFHNMRASRQSELMGAFDLATACQWLGNSPTVAARHYAMNTDNDGSFQRAVSDSSALQKAMHPITETGRMVMQHGSGESEKSRVFQGFANTCSEVHKYILGVPRFELGTSSLSVTRSNQLSYTPANGHSRGRPGGESAFRIAAMGAKIQSRVSWHFDRAVSRIKAIFLARWHGFQGNERNERNEHRESGNEVTGGRHGVSGRRHGAQFNRTAHEKSNDIK